MPFNAYSVPAGTTQTSRIDMDENDTLTVQSTGRLSVSANAQSVRFVAPTSGAVITNDGTIENTNTGGNSRAIRFETGVGATFTATINNGLNDSTATIVSINDAIQIQERSFTGGQLTIDNGGTIRSTTGQAVDFGSATGSLGIAITNRAGGQIIGDVSEAIRIGTTGATVENSGTIAGGNSAGYSASVDGIQFENNASGTVTNNAGGTISGDRHGIDAGVGSTISVINNANGTITGRNGSGVGSDGSGSVTNYGTITGSVTNDVATDANGPGAPGAPDGIPDGDGDGVDVDGTLTLVNFGRIEGLGASGNGGDGLANTSDGVAAGGGTIDNRAGGVIISTDRGILIDNGSQGNSFAQTSIVNAGQIEGTNGIGIRLVSTFADTITNSGTITGGNGTAILFGAGDNTLKLLSTSVINGLTDGEGGADTLDYTDWTAGGVTVDLAAGTASGTGGIANFEKVIGSAGDDQITGNAGNNRLSGGAGMDTLTGGDGNDALVGGAGADDLVGGAGIDTAVYTGSGGRVVVNLLAGQGANADAEGDTLTGIENVQGSGFDDVIGGDEGANGLFGFDGADELKGAGGADRLDGGLGADSMNGGGGNDLFFVDDAGDTVIEATSDGTDTVFVTAAAWTLGAGEEVEFLRVNTGSGVALTGNELNQSIYGGAGADRLAGGGGTDTLYGGAGDDTYVVDSAATRVVESANAGSDTVEASINYTLRSNVENLTLTGSALRGTGNADANIITGNDADNVLSGGAGDDSLIGGLGRDQLIGGDGADTFVFLTVDDSLDMARDLILGFSQPEDLIDLSAIDAIANVDGNQDFTLVEGGAFTGANTAGQLIVKKAGNYTLVQGDVDGGGADFSILLRGDLALDAGNFVL